jgi:hypothetical protein
METPAIPLAIGNCSTDFAFGFFQLEFEGRQLGAGEQRVRHVVLERKIGPGIGRVHPEQCRGRGGRANELSSCHVRHRCSLLLKVGKKQV